MNDILELFLELLERQSESELATIKMELEHMIAIHITLFGGLEVRSGKTGLAKADRRLASLFKRWLKTARRMEASAVGFRASGQSVAYFEDFLQTLERSKPLTQGLDETEE